MPPRVSHVGPCLKTTALQKWCLNERAAGYRAHSREKSRSTASESSQVNTSRQSQIGYAEIEARFPPARKSQPQHWGYAESYRRTIFQPGVLMIEPPAENIRHRCQWECPECRRC